MINEVKELYDYALGRNKRAGRYAIGNLNLIMKSAQLKIINKNVELKGLEVVSFVADVIAPVKSDPTPIAISGGIFPRPADFLYIFGLEHSYTDGDTKFADLDLVRDNEFNNRRNNSVEPPTNEFPICKWTNLGWKALPNNVGTTTSVNITYIKKPADPNWAFTINAGGEVYDEPTSTDFTLGENVFNELVYEMLELSGVNLRQAELVQYANSLGNEGVVNLLKNSRSND